MFAEGDDSALSSAGMYCPANVGRDDMIDTEIEAVGGMLQWAIPYRRQVRPWKGRALGPIVCVEAGFALIERFRLNV